ncbi:SANT/Myb domain [Macleaya cordata]|uniref:SANT/Myb domain n=1 Tax=Macleaya cordata TaxID=56857 RepID=A0A200QDL4_MACCD|nr:SANT/Myb domain [Macleaya cordata]
MTRRCSHCSNNGHNSRTCPTRGGVKLFGVRLTDGSIKKSASMGNLSSHYYSSSSAAASPNPSSPDHLRDPNPIAEGYVSDDPAHTSCSSNCRGERKKGIPWTEEEHRLFLMGLQKLGKGDWRGIARNFVVSRTPTQVASHAQKYFIRQSNATRRKRRSSLFDMVPDLSMEPPAVPEEQFLFQSELGETEHMNSLPSLNLSLDRECDHMETTCNETPTSAEAVEETVTCSNFAPIPVFFPTYLPLPFPFWQPNLGSSSGGEEKGGGGETTSNHQVLKPTPVLSKDTRVNVDELLGMSKLTLGGGGGGGAGTRIEPSPLSIELLGAPSRQSAFHVNQPVSRSDLSKSNKSNAIHAV